MQLFQDKARTYLSVAPNAYTREQLFAVEKFGEWLDREGQPQPVELSLFQSPEYITIGFADGSHLVLPTHLIRSVERTDSWTRIHLFEEHNFCQVLEVTNSFDWLCSVLGAAREPGT